MVHVDGMDTHASAFNCASFLWSHISDCNICEGMLDIVVTDMVAISITAANRNRLACISTPAKTNHTIFFLIISVAESFCMMDCIIIYKNKNHRV